MRPPRIHWRKWARLRRACFDRAGWRCERCGRAGKLECHHRDHDRGNNHASNLECLCTACHLKEHDRLKGQPLAQRWRKLVRALR